MNSNVPLNNVAADYVYKTVGARVLSLSFLPPLEEHHAHAPLYFILPGGGWNSADRGSMLDFSRRSVELLRRAGFAVVSASYRVLRGDGVTMRDIVTDVFDAMRFVARHAQALRVDPRRVATSGHSAGGHLALMLAAAPGALFGGAAEEPFAVTATAPLSPATSLLPLSGEGYLSFSVANAVADEREATDCSPLTWARRCPPALLTYGTHDPLVLPRNSLDFAARCPRAELLPAQGGMHCFEAAQGVARVSPGFDEIQERVAAFAMRAGD